MKNKLRNPISVALKEFKSILFPEKRPFDQNDLSTLLATEKIIHSSIDFPEKKILGFTRDGLNALSKIAEIFRSERAGGAKTVSRHNLALVLARLATSLWKERSSGELTEIELDDFIAATNSWFDQQQKTRKHFIPCNISSYNLQNFEIGPVKFYSIRDFPVGELNLTDRDVWPSDGESHSFMASTLLIEGIFRIAKERNSEMIAEVIVPGREQKNSIHTANLIVDIAIAGFQLVMPQGKFNFSNRATARSAPFFSTHLFLTEGNISQDNQNNAPGRTLLPDFSQKILSKSSTALSSIGRRLDAYLNGTGKTPVLDEAWCNAAYWYHEGLAEQLDTISIAKFETALEVLLRAEKTSGSTSRVLAGIKGFLGIEKQNPIFQNISTEQLANFIVTARSRILHGTWATLNTELPDKSGEFLTNINHVETIIREMLLNYSFYLDKYSATTTPVDDIESFIAWSESNA